MRDDIRLVGRKGRHVEPRYVEYIRRLRPVLFYDFCNQPTKYDTGTRDLVYDLSGNGNHGVINRAYGASVINEKFTSAFDTPVQLDHRYIYTTPAPVVTNPTGDITYTEGTDYTINYTAGQITVLSGGTIPDATACYIDYTYDNTGTSWKHAYLKFDGFDDFINVKSQRGLNPREEITIMSWVKYTVLPSSLASEWEYFFGKSNAWVLTLNGGLDTINPYIDDESGTRHHIGALITGDDLLRWNFVAMTYSYHSGTQIGFANGEIIAELFWTAKIIDSGNIPVRVMGSFYPKSVGLSVVFDRALTAQEINTIYELSRWRYMD